MSRYQNSAEFMAAIGKGEIPDAEISVPSTGIVDGVDSAHGKIDMWDNPNFTNIVDLTTNTDMELVSTDAGDIGGVFVVFGLKDDGVGNWIRFIEVVISNGTTASPLANQCERIQFVAYQAGPNEGTITIRPVGSPADIQVYLHPNQEISRKGIVSLATATTYYPEYFVFGIARETGSGGSTRTGEVYLSGRTNETVYTELFSFALSTGGTSFAAFDVPSTFVTGFPGRKRELKFECLADTNSTKFWSTVFSWQFNK